MRESTLKNKSHLKLPIRSIWAEGTKQEKLDYCKRQINLLAHWFAVTGDFGFRILADNWSVRRDHIKNNKL